MVGTVWGGQGGGKVKGWWGSRGGRVGVGLRG